MQNTGRCQGYRNSQEIWPLFLWRSVLGAMPPGQCYHRDVSGGPAGWGTPHCLEEAGKTSLDGDSRVGLPRVSFPLLCCHSFLEGTKVRAPVALGNTALFSYMREYVKFKGILTKSETSFLGLYYKVNFFLCL